VDLGRFIPLAGEDVQTPPLLLLSGTGITLYHTKSKRPKKTAEE